MVVEVEVRNILSGSWSLNITHIRSRSRGFPLLPARLIFLEGRPRRGAFGGRGFSFEPFGRLHLDPMTSALVLTQHSLI